MAEDTGRGERLSLPHSAVLPSNEPSASGSWPAKERSPLARPGSKWGGHVGQHEKIARATHHGPPKPKCPVSEGEKDSGFSDGSWDSPSAVEQTDTEDQATPCLAPGPAELQKAKGGLLATNLPALLAPLFLIEKMIPQKTLAVSPAAPFLAWSNQHPPESHHCSAARLQEPVAIPKPMLPSQELHFPTLSPHPSIVRHPGWRAEEGPGPAGEPGRHQQFCVAEARAPPAPPAPKEACTKPPGELPGSPQTSALGSPEEPLRPPLPGSASAGGRAVIEGARRLGGQSLARHRRLRNTVEILRRSGLLAITLRTKDLLRQNSSTQRELGQLLCEAVRSSDSQAWARLQDAVGRSAAP